MRKNSARFFLCAALAATLSLSAFAADATSSRSPASSKGKGIQAITKPSDDRTLSFVRPGRVVDVTPKVGDDVKAGQIIARQDDTEEQAALKTDRHKVEITDPISAKAEIAVRDQKQQEVIRMEEANTRNPGSVARSEFEAARLEVVVAGARIEIASDQVDQDKLKIAQTEAAIEKLKLVSPFDGVVAPPTYPNQTILKVGEIADASGAKVIRVVKIDPLWVEVPVPALEARKLKHGDAAQVTFSDDHVQSGAVSVVFPVGDSASSTIIVRVEVPNPDKLQPGENVFVNFGPAASVAVKP